MKTIISLLFVAILVLTTTANPIITQEQQDFSDFSIYCPKKDARSLQKVIQVLTEEVEKRSGLRIETSRKITDGKQIILSLGETKDLPADLSAKLDQMDAIEAEGYKLLTLPESGKIIVHANTKRGALYGVGKLLRMMEVRQGKVMTPLSIGLSSSPAYEIRGHQLGYRPKTNSYDAWTVAQFDQYIRDLAIFGANSIEIMPPRTDDDFTSGHMKLPAIDMIREQSRICDEYDLDVWMWYPNMGSDYEHPDSLKVEMDERHKVFSTVPRLDHLFVPGGDPGDLEPDILFDWLEKEAVVLNKYHPEAKIWISPQVFRPTKEWLGKFFGYINEKPDWLGGVVFGPWVKTPVDDIRKIVDAGIPIRRYPDITHSLSSQYPIPKLDLAWAITLGRECINPRPNDQKMIHNVLDQFANGSLSYSEGTNDDVNKFIWSDQDWDPETPVIETLRDYARYFISPDHTEAIAQGILALEQNIDGPLLTNEHVQNTLMQWQAIEESATPEMQNNFRYQMGLIRAYHDAYVQKRLTYEVWLEQNAKEALSKYPKIGIPKAVEMSRSILAEAWEQPIDDALKTRCYELADDLFESIGAQLTIEKHGAMGGRGNFMDNIDNPLNDVAWIYSQLNKVEKASSAPEMIRLLNETLERTNPGPGGFYDNFGNPSAWNRVIFRNNVSEDPGNLKTPRVSFGVGLQGKEWVHVITAKGFEGDAAPMAWMNQVTTLYDQPMEIRYDNLDPDAEYGIRVSYTGRFRSRMRMEADGIEVHDFIKTGIEPTYELPIPQEALKDGEVIFSWTCGEAERGSQVSEIWIIKK